MKNIVSLIVLVAFVFAMSFTTGCVTRNNYSQTTETYFPDGKLKGKQITTDKSLSVNQPLSSVSRPARVVVAERERGHLSLFRGGFQIGGAPSGVVYDMDHGSPIRVERNYNAPKIEVPIESQKYFMDQTWRRYH